MILQFTCKLPCEPYPEIEHMKSNSCIARMVYRAKIVFFCLKNEFSASKQRKMMQKAIEMR